MERNAGVPVALLSPRDLATLAPRMDPTLAARARRLGQRSDYYRSHLLAAQGGMWLDVDSIAFRDVTWIFEGAEATGVGLRTNNIGVGTAPLVARPGSEVISRWIELQETILRGVAEGEDVEPWTALGSSALSEARHSAPYYEIPRRRIAPVHWQKADVFTSRYHRPDEVLSDDVTLVNLYNERFPAWLKTANEEEILSSPIMLARLLRIALGESDLVEEHRWNDPLGRLVESVSQTLLRAGRWGRRRVTARLGPH